MRPLTWAVAVAGILLASSAVTAVSSLRTPKYEATAKVWVDVRSTECSRGVCPIPLAPAKDPAQIALGAVHIDSPSVAKETIQRLGLRMPPDELLDNLTVRRDMSCIGLSYTDTNPAGAKEIVRAVGQIATERITGTRTEELPLNTELTAAVFSVKATHEPVSPRPLRNGAVVLTAGLVLLVLYELVRRTS